MSTSDVFSVSVKYKFKTGLLSISSFVVFILNLSVIVLPLIIAYQTGGFWIKNRMYIEKPKVAFTHKYLLLVEKAFDKPPIVCSSFTTYQKNPINDDCSLFKIREIDTNKDQHKDILKFEAQFYSDTIIRSVKLLMYFKFELTEITVPSIETLAIFDFNLPDNVQKIHMIGDLKLNQKGPIHQESFKKLSDNKTFELSDYSLDEVLAYNAKKSFSGQLINTHRTWQMGHSSDEPIIVSGEIFYAEQLLYYQPSIWEELKGAWIQYFSVLTIFAYLVKRILKFLFTKSYLRSYVVTPWNEK